LDLHYPAAIAAEGLSLSPTHFEGAKNLQIPLSQPDINEQDRDAVMDVLHSNALSLGPKLPEFEQAAAAATGSEYAVAVNSGTSALHLCVKAAGIGEGDEVITTPFSFVASSNCVLFENAKPVFVDIDPITFNIDPSAIADAITPATKAIVPVHVFGRPCAITEIQAIGERHGLTVIEDSCEAIGATFQGKAVGSFGQTGVFAFYPNKQLTTGEGGVIVTDDKSVAAKCRSWRNQGRAEGDAWLEHATLGYNYRLSDINCALGVSQFSRLPEIIDARSRVAKLYDDALKNVPGILPPRLTEPDATISWFVYVVRLTDEFSRDQRDQVLLHLRSNGVACRNYFSPIHLQPFYAEKFGYRRGHFPVTEFISERTIALPFYNRLSEGEVGYVCEILREAVSGLKRKSVAATEAVPAA
jgi:perosamine synthetase